MQNWPLELGDMLDELQGRLNLLRGAKLVAPAAA